MRTPVELTAAFRERGLKVTPQRQLLFRLLHGNEVHPSADTLFAVASAEMPGISLRTVYQTLNDLAAMGELMVLDLGTGATRFDPNLDDHHHLVCRTCNRVSDVYVGGVERLSMEGGIPEFAIDSASIVFRGLCSTCTTPEP